MNRSLKSHSWALLLTGLLAGISHAQCQLAFNDPPEQVDLSTLVDPSMFDGIDPETEVLTDFPTCSLPMLRAYAYSLFETGEHELQARIYTYILRHERSVLDLYNLACCYSRMGMADKTLEYLGQAFAYGYEDIGWVEQDSDMDIIRGTPGYRDLLDSYRVLIAERDSRQGMRLMVECPSMLPCRLVLPEDFDPSLPHSLVIGLHGAGDTAERFSRLPGYFGDGDFIYVAPEAPYPVQGTDTYVWFDGPMDSGDEAALARDLLVEYLDNVISEMRGMYTIDEIYLVGFSQGAAVAYMEGISRPDLIDGIVVFGGWLDPAWFTESELSAADGLRVFIAHGSEDNIQLAEQSHAILDEFDYDVAYREFPGGHFIHLDTLLEAVGWMGE